MSALTESPGRRFSPAADPSGRFVLELPAGHPPPAIGGPGPKSATIVRAHSSTPAPELASTAPHDQAAPPPAPTAAPPAHLAEENPLVICHRAGCGKPVPDRRFKYCCNPCLRAAHRDAKATLARRRQLAIEAHGGPLSGTRICLSCDRPFLSDGPWNRICPRCGEREGGPRRAAGAPIRTSMSLSELRRLVGE